MLLLRQRICKIENALGKYNGPRCLDRAEKGRGCEIMGLLNDTEPCGANRRS